MSGPGPTPDGRARQRIRVIVNPSARSGRGPRALRSLREAPPPDVSVEWVESQSGAHLCELVAAAATSDTLDAVAVAGGDGTVALAASALGAGARVPLGILPIGSGNDFARDLGIPRRLPDAFRVLCEGSARSVDVVEDAHGARVICVASVGFDALALPVVHGGLPRSKALNVYAAVQALFRYRPRPMRVSWAGGGYEGPLMFVAATNTRGYGGGFRITPEARVDDGLLDICLVQPAGKARLLRIFSSVMSGTHGRFPEITLVQSPWVRIEGAAGELPVSFDGEPRPGTTPVYLCCRPSALRVICAA